MMKRALCLILVAVVLAALSCESNTPSPPNALAIVRAAEENLRTVSSFHIAIIAEEDGRETSVRADIVPPDMGRFVISGLAERTIRIEIETLQVSRANYTLYPGFQAWVDMDEMSLYRFDLQSFPYELSGLREAVESFELLGEGVIDGVDAYRLAAIGTEELRQKVHLRPGVGVPEVELWDKPGRPAPPAHRDHHRRPGGVSHLHLFRLRRGSRCLRALNRLSTLDC